MGALNPRAMGLSVARAALLFAATAFVACSTETVPPGGKDATTSTADGAAGQDGAMMSMDGAMMSMDAEAMDALMSVDAGNGMDATAMNDGGGGGVNCTELSACCPSLPMQAQMTCVTTSAGGDEAMCLQRLNIYRNLGQCGGQPDSGTGPVDAGPLGPACSELDGCCAMAGALAGICMNVARGGDEGRCQQILDLAQGRGLCLPADGGVGMDAMSMDTGTSTTSMDAGLLDSGTSTTADASVTD